MISINFCPETSQRIIDHFDEEIERLLPDLKRIIKLWWKIEWGEGTHEHSPSTELTIDIHSLPKEDGLRNHVFSIGLYSDSNEEIHIHAQKYNPKEDSWSIIGSVKTNTSDWGIKDLERG